VGCAAWHGPRLRDVLKQAGVKPEAVEIWFDGADRTLAPDGAGYRKSLPIDKALADETLVATSMNEGPLPLLNGYPARLVVPGWVGEYWIKHLTRIVVSTQPLTNSWMQSDARLPSGTGPFASQNTAASVPVTELMPYALIASPVHGDEVERSGFAVRGAAWDRGSGILRVDVSLDGGQSWQSALLDREIGRYGFRTFRLETGFLQRGPTELVVRAISNKREAQPDSYQPKLGGYLNNVPQRLTVAVV
jgi:DMSO/TMAO reductase YedYZ molybdopterin-dependent catalytic subunit